MNFKKIHSVFMAGHFITSILFVACAFVLMVLAVMNL